MPSQLFEQLTKEHQEVKELLEKIREAGDGASAKRDEMFGKLKKELKGHMKGEEHALYPALKEKSEARSDAFESIEEHHVAEMVLNELDRMKTREERWMAKLTVFKELIEHHVEEEESNLFPTAGKLLSEDQLQGILKKYQDEKQKVMKNAR